MPENPLQSGHKPESVTVHEPADDIGNFGNPYFRWTVLYAVVIFVFTLSPIWLSFVIPDQIIYYDSLILSVFALIWIAIAFNAIRNMGRMLTVPSPTIEGLKVSRTREFYHIVVVPCYLDPIEVLFDALGTLLMQADTSRLIVVVAFEAKTPELASKEKAVYDAFHRRFKHLLITKHVLNPAKEIAGGCSNKNFALRSAYSYAIENGLLDANNVTKRKPALTVTTCDTDSLFHPNYFVVLEQVYNAQYPNQHPGELQDLRKADYCVWQPPLFYNWDLDERPFFNRITCLTRSLMMLGGLIGFDLNPMSVFSYPVELGLQAGFINPRYGVDDIIAKVRWMCTTDQRIPVQLLPIPCISGPTIGTNIFEEYDEWARQIRRWIIGSSESFHYFVIHFRGKPFFAGIAWFSMFFIYYAVLLCSAGIFSLLAGITWPWIDYPSFPGSDFSMTSIGWMYLATQYLVFAVAFWIDYRAKQLLTVREKSLSLWRNILHWLVAPISLLVYSFIAFAAILAFVWRGKQLAKHDMAAKAGLESWRVDNQTSTPASSAIPAVRRSTSVSKEQQERLSISRMSFNEHNTAASAQQESAADLRSPSAGSGGRPSLIAMNVVPSSESKENPSKEVISQAAMQMPKKFWFGEYCYDVPELDHDV